VPTNPGRAASSSAQGTPASHGTSLDACLASQRSWATTPTTLRPRRAGRALRATQGLAGRWTSRIAHRKASPAAPHPQTIELVVSSWKPHRSYRPCFWPVMGQSPKCGPPNPLRFDAGARRSLGARGTAGPETRSSRPPPGPAPPGLPGLPSNSGNTLSPARTSRAWLSRPGRGLPAAPVTQPRCLEPVAIEPGWNRITRPSKRRSGLPPIARALTHSGRSRNTAVCTRIGGTQGLIVLHLEASKHVNVAHRKAHRSGNLPPLARSFVQVVDRPRTLSARCGCGRTLRHWKSTRRVIEAEKWQVPNVAGACNVTLFWWRTASWRLTTGQS